MRLGLGLLGVLLCAPGVAWAQPASAPARVELRWEQGPDAWMCIHGDDLRSMVERRLRRDVFVDSGADFAVDGRITVEPDGYRATLQMHAADGSPAGLRELRTTGQDCSALSEPLALVLSLLVDLPGAPTVIDIPPADAPALPAAPAEPPGAPAPGPRWHFIAEAGAALSWGIVPRTAVGPRVAVAAQAPRVVGLELEGSVTAWRQVEQGGVTAELRLASAGLSVCARLPRRGRLTGELCAGGLLGSLRRDASGTERLDPGDAPDGTDLFAALVGRARARVAIAGPLAATLGLGLLAPVTRYRLTFEDADGTRRSLYEAAPVGVAMDLGLGVAL